MERRRSLSLTEWATLALLVERPRHGYDISIELQPGGVIGHVWSAPRHAVYRALERLAALGHVTRSRTEAGDSAPQRTVYESTGRGRDALAVWLDEPVEHLREVRSGLLLKLVLAERLGRRCDGLVAAQRRRFAPLLDERASASGDDGPVGRWRYHAARAVEAFLSELESGSVSVTDQ